MCFVVVFISVLGGRSGVAVYCLLSTSMYMFGLTVALKALSNSMSSSFQILITLKAQHQKHYNMKIYSENADHWRHL